MQNFLPLKSPGDPAWAEKPTHLTQVGLPVPGRDVKDEVFYLFDELSQFGWLTLFWSSINKQPKFQAASANMDLNCGQSKTSGSPESSPDSFASTHLNDKTMLLFSASRCHPIPSPQKIATALFHMVFFLQAPRPYINAVSSTVLLCFKILQRIIVGVKCKHDIVTYPTSWFSLLFFRYLNKNISCIRDIRIYT